MFFHQSASGLATGSLEKVLTMLTLTGHASSGSRTNIVKSSRIPSVCRLVASSCSPAALHPFRDWHTCKHRCAPPFEDFRLMLHSPTIQPGCFIANRPTGLYSPPSGVSLQNSTATPHLQVNPRPAMPFLSVPQDLATDPRHRSQRQSGGTRVVSGMMSREGRSQSSAAPAFGLMRSWAGQFITGRYHRGATFSEE